MLWCGVGWWDFDDGSGGGLYWGGEVEVGMRKVFEESDLRVGRKEGRVVVVGWDGCVDEYIAGGGRRLNIESRLDRDETGRERG